MSSSNVVSEEFVRRILKASPLTNPFLTRGVICVLYVFFLKCVLTSRIDFSWNLVPLCIIDESV